MSTVKTGVATTAAIVKRLEGRLESTAFGCPSAARPQPAAAAPR
jgi:hypothetical protein